MTRKYTTAFTFSETLSRVMTSCGGTSHVTTRSETRTIRSIGQMMSTSPGPFSCFRTVPRRNTTARSYSRRMLRHRNTKMRMASAANTAMTMVADGRGRFAFMVRLGLDGERRSAHPAATNGMTRAGRWRPRRPPIALLSQSALIPYDMCELPFTVRLATQHAEHVGPQRDGAAPGLDTNCASKEPHSTAELPLTIGGW